MKTYWIKANITVPADTTLYRPDWSETSYGYPLEVTGEIPAYKDGRIKGSKALWKINHHYTSYLVKQNALLEIKNRRVVGRR